jgi:uncharacterized protein (DUF1778 family)
MTLKESRLEFVLSPEEKALIEAAAKAKNLNRSAYVRMVILEDAKRVIAKERAWR